MRRTFSIPGMSPGSGSFTDEHGCRRKATLIGAMGVGKIFRDDEGEVIGAVEIISPIVKTEMDNSHN